MLFQMDSGYRYNSDSLLLYDFISSFKPKGKLLDVGCGCGILGLLLKRDFPALDVCLLDIQEQNCTLTRANAQQNELTCKAIECGDFLEISFEQKFDFIISNPPFYHGGSVKSEEPSLSISRHNSALPLEKFAKKVTKTLSNRGYFIFCYDAKQLDIIAHALIENGLKIEDILCVHVKEDKEASLVLIRARKSSKSLCKIHPPLFMYQNDMISPKVQAIYDKSQTKSLAWKI